MGIKCFLSLIVATLCSISAMAQNATINSVILEHDATINGETGMLVHVDVNIRGLKDKGVTVICYILDENKNKHVGHGSNHTTPNGQVCSFVNLTPRYNDSHYSDCKIFFPYDQFNFKPGRHRYYIKTRVYITSNKKFIESKSSYKSFTGTGGDNIGHHYQDNVIEYGSPTGTGGRHVKNPDGSSTVTTRYQCHACAGSLQCNICAGTGNAYYIIGRYMPCPNCSGTGSCPTCKGKGYTEFTKTWQPGEAESYMKAKREVEAESKGSKRSDDIRRQSNDYIEKIYYDPDYVGSDELKWCDKCNKYTIPHRHIRERVR